MLSSSRRDPLTNFAKGLLPVGAAMFLVWWSNQVFRREEFGAYALLILSAVVLWFGWSLIRRSMLTKWLAILVIAYLGVIAGVWAIAIGLSLAMPLFLLFLLAVPWIIYDFFFRAPKEGRFTRAREARRNSIPN